MAAHVQDVFMLIGASITQRAWEPGFNGFGQRLSHVYARKFDVINRGLSGYNTAWGIPVFEQCIAKRSDTSAPKLRVLVIWFGGNDSCIKPSEQHVPLPEFVVNLKKMVQMVTSPTSPHYSPTTRIILVTPSPVNTIMRREILGARKPPIALDRGFEVTRSYANAVRDVAKEEGVAFVDVWTSIWEAAGKDERSLSKFLVDGLHLNENGYKIVYEELIKTIAKEYPDVHYDNVGHVFPSPPFTGKL